MKKLLGLAAAIAAACVSVAAHASDGEIRKALESAYPGIPIASVAPAPVPGLFEVLVGSDIVYTDAHGKYLVQGVLVDVASKRNLTEERLQVINRVDFKALPLDRAIVTKRGAGERKMVVFADPNCGYCKRLEREYLPGVKNVTIYTVLIPILSPDSVAKSRNVWCAADRAKAWDDLILRDVPAPLAAEGCDTKGLDANLEFAKKHRVTGTPTMFFEDGARLAGALPTEQIEKRLAGGLK